jgi:TPR repeat protein
MTPTVWLRLRRAVFFAVKSVFIRVHLWLKSVFCRSSSTESMMRCFWCLVPKQCIIVIMDKSSLRKMFSSPQKPVLEMAPPEADHEDAEVQFHLGLKFASGNGAGLDYVQAVEWYRKAAEQNHFLAQFNLGMMYAYGQGVARDTVQSRMWLGKAAHQGDAGAQFHLGDNCHRASFRQMPADAYESRIEAYKWYRLAAAQGYEGSDAAYSALTFNMTREDVAAGNQRIAAFEIGKTKSGS